MEFNLKDFNLEVFWKVWNQNLKLYFRSFEWGTYHLCIFDIIGATGNFVKCAGKKTSFSARHCRVGPGHMNYIVSYDIHTWQLLLPILLVYICMPVFEKYGANFVDHMVH